MMNRACDWRRAQDGAVIVMFAILIPVIISAAGISLDMSRAYLVQQRLQGALDASALAGAASASDEEVVEQQVRDFFAQNYPPNKIGIVTDGDLTIDVQENDVVVSARAIYPTSFMRMLGRTEIPVYASTTVNRQIMGLEVVMVVDVTGSMCIPDCTNMDALMTAARNFTTILFNRAERPEDIKIGIVPYSTSVNVGPYLFGRNFDESINYPDPNDHMANLPYQVWWDNSRNRLTTSTTTRITYDGAAEEVIDNTSINEIYPNWRGCVLEDRHGGDVADHEGPWSAYYDTRRKSRTVQVCTRYHSNGSCRTWQNQTQYYFDPNEYCPRTPILPLTSDQDSIMDAIDGFEAYGATLGNVGMVWGWRVLSHAPPFTEAEPPEDRRWRKAIVMMTDGDNNLSATYTAYGLNSSHNLNTNSLNERFLDVCQALKQEDVLVYTVTFTSAINNNTKAYYRNCATSTAQYFDAPTPAQLIAVFERISRELSTLHVKQ